MPYLLIEDGFADNSKITGLSDKAFRLHMSALVYCARNLTDGAISELALRSAALNSKIARPKGVVDDLVSAGLWVANGQGWKIHDYLKYNPSRLEMAARREAARKRKQRQRNQGHDVTSRVTDAVSHATQDPLPRPLKGSLGDEPLEGSPLKPQTDEPVTPPAEENIRRVRELAASIGIKVDGQQRSIKPAAEVDEAGFDIEATA